MLDFSEFFTRDQDWTMTRSFRDFEPDYYACLYLITIQNQKKQFQMEDSFYSGFLNFLGTNGLKAAINCIKQRFRKKVVEEDKLYPAWKSIYELLNFQQWNFVLAFLIKLTARKMQRPEKSVFEKRLDLLCETLNLCDTNKEILRFLYLNDYSEPVKTLYDKITEAIKTSRSRISYAVIGLLTNYSEETVLEAISKERGLINLNILSGTERDGIGIPFEIRRYLKGLGSDNFVDIYAKSDNKNALHLEKFDCQKEANYIIDSISMHQNDKSLHFLLYGVEGTGKTELARTIAANANCELLDIGRGVKKQTLEENDDVRNQLKKFRIRALTIAEMALRNKGNLILMVDEADLLLNFFEKGVLNQILEDTRLPVIWISNDLHFVEKSSLRRFNFSIKFKANNESMRFRIWESVVEKHDAGKIFTPERIKTLATKYDANPGGIELAVSSEMQFVKNGKQEEVAELVLKQHLELLHTPNNNKNMQSRAPKYDESVLNVQGIENAMYAAKCYAECLKNKETESNCTMLLYGPPGTGKTEFARHLARLSGLTFKEISYGKISSCYVGETEKRLAEAFEEASKEGALLFIDEADSLISDRRNANHSWETTQINEFLIQLENCKCLVVCSTNFQGKLDAASNRRFHFHLRFDYLKKDGILKMAQNFFPEFEQERWGELCNLECLAPGDFYAVHKRLQWLPKNELSVSLVTKELREVAFAKEPYGNRRIGF
ncbi:MAG: AAA family ATPase [Candidatus Fibromonas sp.]|jgi:SpoVK/Ycf46/Vps4 family AAA+-type ATPase|nr:AAA family ATPase [Candidatus Fibromonas sp.]